MLNWKIDDITIRTTFEAQKKYCDTGKFVAIKLVAQKSYCILELNNRILHLMGNSQPQHKPRIPKSWEIYCGSDNLQTLKTYTDDAITLSLNRAYQIHSLIIYQDENPYIQGISVTYIHSVKKKQYTSSLFISNKNCTSKKLELREDEFITRIFGKKGSLIDSLGFETNLGQICEAGGQGGEPFSWECPQGFHCWTFAGGMNNDRLVYLGFHIEAIPKGAPGDIPATFSNDNITQERFRKVFYMISDFLSIPDHFNLFMTSKYFAEFKDDGEMMSKLAWRVIYYPISCEKFGRPRIIRHFLKKIVKRGENYYWSKPLAHLIQVSKNYIKNSSGSRGFEGWQIISNAGDNWKVDNFLTEPEKKTVFVSSYGVCSMIYNVDLTTPDEKSKIDEWCLGKSYFVAGVLISRRWDCPAKGGLKVIIEFNDGKTKELISQMEDLPYVGIPEKSWVHLYHIIDKELFEVGSAAPKRIGVFLWGVDKKFWAGWYGARFSGAYLRYFLKKEYLNDIMKSMNQNQKEDDPVTNFTDFQTKKEG